MLAISPLCLPTIELFVLQMMVAPFLQHFVFLSPGTATSRSSIRSFSSHGCVSTSSPQRPPLASSMLHPFAPEPPYPLRRLPRPQSSHPSFLWSYLRKVHEGHTTTRTGLLRCGRIINSLTGNL